MQKRFAFKNIYGEISHFISQLDFAYSFYSGSWIFAWGHCLSPRADAEGADERTARSLLGTNGCGKSTLLGIISSAATGPGGGEMANHVHVNPRLRIGMLEQTAVSGSELSVRDEVMSRMVPPLAPLSKFFLLQWPSSRKRKCYDMLCVSEKFDIQCSMIQ